MGVFGFWGKKKEESRAVEELIFDGAKSPEVIVPDHAKPQEVKKEVKVPVSKFSGFKITSVYDVGGEVMLSGVVETGFLKKRMRTKIGDKDILIRDVKVGTQSVKELPAGKEGTIFLKGKNIHFLRTDDVLEFK